MTKFVELSQVDTSNRGDSYNDDGELIEAGEVSSTIYINVASIRSFKTRRGNNGTFIKFLNGAGISVSESLADVHAVVIGDDDTNVSDAPRLTHEDLAYLDARDGVAGA